jgi:hypothetical protein
VVKLRHYKENELQNVWLSINNDKRIIPCSEHLIFIALTTKAASSHLAPAYTSHINDSNSMQLSTTRSVLWLLVTANVPSSPILVTPMVEAIHSSETSILTKATQRNNPEEVILQGQSHFSLFI